MYHIEVDRHTHPKFQLPVFAYCLTHATMGIIATGDAPTPQSAYQRAMRKASDHALISGGVSVSVTGVVRAA